MIWLEENFGPISTYAIHSGHHKRDGLGGHTRGYALDLNSIQGHDFGSNDPDGTYAIKCAKALRAAPAGIRPLGMIIDGWQSVYRGSAATQYCIPDGSYTFWEVPRGSHSNHIHICYTPGIPT
jgi:hypothetical protein